MPIESFYLSDQIQDLSHSSEPPAILIPLCELGLPAASPIATARSYPAVFTCYFLHFVAFIDPWFCIVRAARRIDRPNLKNKFISHLFENVQLALFYAESYLIVNFAGMKSNGEVCDCLWSSVGQTVTRYLVVTS